MGHDRPGRTEDESLRDRRKLFTNDTVIQPVSAALAFENTGLPEHFQVMAHCRLRETHSLGEVASTGLGARLRANETQESNTRRVCERSKQRRQLLRVGMR
jgi:hypothetical protein